MCFSEILLRFLMYSLSFVLISLGFVVFVGFAMYSYLFLMVSIGFAVFP